MTLGQLLNRQVVTESGVKVGRVHDVRGELVGGRLRVTGFATGNQGFLDRLGIGTGSSTTEAKAHDHAITPWERVLRVSAEIILRD
jgi:sporulation protein YlmC with PRC-barrel domain